MKWVIEQKPDDPDGILRASIGGQEGIGFYCIYRGNAEDVIDLLERALLRLKIVQSNPPPTP